VAVTDLCVRLNRGSQPTQDAASSPTPSIAPPAEPAQVAAPPAPIEAAQLSLPPAESLTFLGDSGRARRIVFVCDASGSMRSKFSALRGELSKSIGSLWTVQSFDLFFFQNRTFIFLDEDLLWATPEAKLRADEFVKTVSAFGETDPIPALEMAFKQKPDLIYLLTDGDFSDSAAVLGCIHHFDKDAKVKINTIAFVADTDNDTEFMELLKKIAQETGGVYRYVRESDR
jgi:hypothetical protein